MGSHMYRSLLVSYSERERVHDATRQTPHNHVLPISWDPWRGSWVTVIPTPTSLKEVEKGWGRYENVLREFCLKEA